MEKYRLQITFDIKNEHNKSVLGKDVFNTVSRDLRAEMPTKEQEEMLRIAIMQVVSQCEESPQFQNLFCVKIDYGCNAEGNALGEIKYIEIPSEHLSYHSLIHSKEDTHLFPFVNKELWINRDAFSKSRLWLRKIRYYWNSLCELIRL